MRKLENGIYCDMTPEEIAEHKERQAQTEAAPKTPEERIAELEEALALLFEGAVE